MPLTCLLVIFMVAWITPRSESTLHSLKGCDCSHIKSSGCFITNVHELITQIGLSASTIASSFGKAISENKELEDYRPEDISLSLLRMISYNIGQVCHLEYLISVLD